MSVVLHEDHDGVALITIDRPQARNAIDAEAALALAGIVAEVERDASVQVAILTGAGDKAFCAGADLKELASGSAPGGRSTSEGGFAGFVHAPLALRASLALARRAFDLNDAVLRAEADAAGRRVMASADAREGPRAFAEHRPPRWTGA